MKVSQDPQCLLRTGQLRCYSPGGREISCPGSAQDAELLIGRPWPEPRFVVDGEVVTDCLTGLTWSGDANPAQYPVGWHEAFETTAAMNRDAAFGRRDWRVPNRRELRSLLSHQESRPALPAGHPFRNLFQGWYWTSTTAAISPAFAWYVHLAGARMFYGHKQRFALLWPVCGQTEVVLRTGQEHCFDESGAEVPCQRTGQDGELRLGRPWPDPRFRTSEDGVIDLLTGLCWRRDADLCGGPVIWAEALEAVRTLNRNAGTSEGWRLPNINELESLVDCARHSPALPAPHPFRSVDEEYWSSTTSVFEPDWAWALYLAKGAIGVGQKGGRYFRVWPVKDAASLPARDPDDLAS